MRASMLLTFVLLAAPLATSAVPPDTPLAAPSAAELDVTPLEVTSGEFATALTAFFNVTKLGTSSQPPPQGMLLRITLPVGAAPLDGAFPPTPSGYARVSGWVVDAGRYEITYMTAGATNAAARFQIRIDAFSEAGCPVGAPALASAWEIDLTTADGVVVHDAVASQCHRPPPADVTPPVLSGLIDKLDIEATGPAGAVVAFAVTATDAVDGEIPVTCTSTTLSTFPIGSTLVECSASDAAGNMAQGSFLVEVQDTTAPVLDTHEDITVTTESDEGAIVSYTPPTATDAVDGILTNVTCAPASGTSLPIGEHTITCDVSDAHENPAASTTFLARVVQESVDVPPTIAEVEDITREARGPAGTLVEYALPEASDPDDPAPPVTCAPAPGSVFALGDTVVTCSASGAEDVNFLVTIVDTTPPEIAAPEETPIVAVLPSPESTEVEVDYGPVATDDLVDGAGAAECVPASGSVFPLGDTTVACNATDAAGNAASALTFTVRVVEPPLALAAADDISAEAEGTLTNVSFALPTATGQGSASATVSCTPAPGSGFPLGPSIVDCTATSGSETASTRFTLTVADTRPPMIAAVDDIVVEATSASGAAVNYTVPFASDLVDGAVGVACSPAAGSLQLGATIVTCTAADSRSNVATRTFSVVVRDTTAPVIEGEDVITQQGSGGMTFGATDAVGVTSLDVTLTLSNGAAHPMEKTLTGARFAGVPVGAHRVEVVARDAAGHVATRILNLTVQEPPAPPPGSGYRPLPAAPPAPTASFEVPSGLTAGSHADLVAMLDGTNAGSLFTWDLGDGATATGAAVGHAWNAGTYTITLTVRLQERMSVATRTLEVAAAAGSGATTGDGSQDPGPTPPAEEDNLVDSPEAFPDDEPTTPPSVRALSPTGIVASPVSVSFEVDDGALVYWRIGPEDAWRTAIPAIFSGDGPVTVEYYASGGGGRSDTKTFTVVVDGAPPSVTSAELPAAVDESTALVIRADVQDVSEVTARVLLTPTNGGVPLSVDLVRVEGGLRLGSVVPDGEYEAQLLFTDAVGRETVHSLQGTVVVGGSSLEESSVPGAEVARDAPGLGWVALLLAVGLGALVARRRHS